MLLQLNKISNEAVESLKGSFDRLPHTDHKDGAYRLRRYSVIELRDNKEGVEISDLPVKEFTQSDAYNKHQGGVKRKFENAEEGVLQSGGFKEMCLSFKRAFNMADGQIMDVHQLRVVTQDDGVAKVAPEGIHQDGFDYIAMIGINRHNISGGELLAYETKKSAPFLNYKLKNGDILMLKDSELWHNAAPIVAYPKQEERGRGDWFVLCANKE